MTNNTSKISSSAAGTTSSFGSMNSTSDIEKEMVSALSDATYSPTLAYKVNEAWGVAADVLALAQKMHPAMADLGLVHSVKACVTTALSSGSFEDEDSPNVMQILDKITAILRQTNEALARTQEELERHATAGRGLPKQL